MATMQRSQIKLAAYNPRDPLDSFAKEKLTANLKEVGLLEPLVVNSRSGTLISGHARIGILDELAGKGTDYELTVALVDLDEKTEKEQVVFLNNEICMGTYDVDALQKQIEKGLDYSKCGFTESQLSAVLPNWDPPQKEKKAKKKGPDAPPHCVLVFRDRAQSDRFLQMMGMSQFEKFLNGMPLIELVKRGQAHL